MDAFVSRGRLFRIVTAATATVLVGAGLLITTACTRDGEGKTKDPKAEEANKKKSAPVPVEVAKASLGEAYSTIDSFSTIESEQQAEIYAKSDGMIERLLTEEGDMVREGAVLATIAPEDRAIQHDTARIKAENARRELERARATHDQQMISDQEYEKLKNAADVAEQDLKEAGWRLANTKVIAPFAGKIVERRVVAGKTVKQGDHLFSIASYNPLVAKIYLPQRDLASIQLGQKAVLVPEAAPGVKWQGEVFRISPVIDPKTGTVKLTVKITPQPGEVEQRPGAYVRVQIKTATRANTVLVPKQAIFEESEKSYLFIAKNGKAEKREVQVGYASNGNAEIVKGVAAGEMVVTSGMTSLKENADLDVLGAREKTQHATR